MLYISTKYIENSMTLLIPHPIPYHPPVNKPQATPRCVDAELSPGGRSYGYNLKNSNHRAIIIKFGTKFLKTHDVPPPSTSHQIMKHIRKLVTIFYYIYKYIP